MKSEGDESTYHPATPSGGVLVVGYGNTLRGDDAAGPRAASTVASWKLPGVIVKAVHQLTPELAESLASVSLAVFIDARVAVEGGGVEEKPIEPLDSGPGTALGHVTDPRHLLALTLTAYGTCARSLIYTVPAADFSLGEGLSPVAERGVEEVLRRLASRLGGPSPRGSTLFASRTHSERVLDRSSGATLRTIRRGS